MTALGDSLVPLLSPHYSDDDITRLFIPEPYPTPLLPMPPHPACQNTKPLFLPDTKTKISPQLESPFPPIALDKPQYKMKDLVILPDNLPPAGSLAAELLVEAKYQATAKEREAAQLAELLKNNTDPTGRRRHTLAKEKKAAQSSTSKSPSCFPPH